ncbi:IclR family transcriptional regulator [Nocardioides sp. YIM 152588]|uniref:IclR family transcriptional regulator n=1 Tax=Nocardioides sp. YIM 152588 TaxID=3158259 RepID=UPI0032E3C051
MPSGTSGHESQPGAAPKSVVARALSLLDAFGADDVELTLSDLCERTGLPKTTVHRFVGELVEWGALERSRYGLRLGFRLFSLGEQVARYQRLRDLSTPFLEDLYEATRESAHLAVLDGSEVLYLAKVRGHGSTPTLSRIGGRLPSHCTGVGKALLSVGPQESLEDRLSAGLPRLTPHTVVTPGLLERDLNASRERGYSIDREETRMGIVSVAAPILDRRAEPVAAIAVAGRTHNIRVDRIATSVQSAAARLSAAIGGPGA